MLPQPVRSQVACIDALYGNPHTFPRQKCLQPLHAFKGDNASHISKKKMSSTIAWIQRRQCPHTFRRQKCLQSLHAFKGDNVLTHFEDDNVFSHCVPSKGDNDPHLHFEDDNVFSHCMPSKVTMSSSTCRRRQCLQSLHAFKRRECLHFHFEDDNVFTSKTSISFFPVLCRTRCPLFVRFFFKKKESENENENELKEKRRNFKYLQAFTGFTAWICASGRSGKDSARMKLVSYLYFPFMSNKR